MLAKREREYISNHGPGTGLHPIGEDDQTPHRQRHRDLCGVTLTTNIYFISSDHSGTIVIFSFQQDQNKDVQSSIFDG